MIFTSRSSSQLPALLAVVIFIQSLGTLCLTLPGFPRHDSSLRIHEAPLESMDLRGRINRIGDKADATIVNPKILSRRGPAVFRAGKSRWTESVKSIENSLSEGEKNRLLERIGTPLQWDKTYPLVSRYIYYPSSSEFLPPSIDDLQRGFKYAIRYQTAMPIWAPSSNSSSSRTPPAAAQNRDFNTGAYNIPNPSDDEDEQHESDDADATPTTSARRPDKPRVKMTLINSQTWKPIPWTFPPAKLRSKLKPYKKAEYTASNQHYLMLPDDELHGPIVSFESIPKQPGSRWNFWQVRNFFKRPQPMPEGTLIFIQIYRQQFQEEAAEDADAKTDSDTGASVVDAGSGAQDWAPEYGYRAGGGGQSSPADNPFTRW